MSNQQLNFLLTSINKKMALHSLAIQIAGEPSVKLKKRITYLESILLELNKHELKPSVETVINQQLVLVNAPVESESLLMRRISKLVAITFRQLEKEMKLVPINYYRNMWTALGMSAFGLPIGVSIGMLTKNMGLLGVGLPFGMAIGLMVGTNLDKKAKEKGLQLPITMQN